MLISNNYIQYSSSHKLCQYPSYPQASPVIYKQFIYCYNMISMHESQTRALDTRVSDDPLALAVPRHSTRNKYTPAVAREICDRIASGESINSIGTHKHLPTARNIEKWLLDPNKKAFKKLYEQAKKIQMALMAEQLIDIADNGDNDWVKRENKEGEAWWKLNGENINRSKLRVETRKWILARMMPKIYGDRIDVTSNVVFSLSELRKSFQRNEVFGKKPVIDQ